MGRLFDAVGFVFGFHQPIYFEGEAAIYLEKLAQKYYSTSNNKLVDYLENFDLVDNCIPTKSLFDNYSYPSTKRDSSRRNCRKLSLLL